MQKIRQYDTKGYKIFIKKQLLMVCRSLSNCYYKTLLKSWDNEDEIFYFSFLLKGLYSYFLKIDLLGNQTSLDLPCLWGKGNMHGVSNCMLFQISINISLNIMQVMCEDVNMARLTDYMGFRNFINSEGT